jgi:hypothetical protein
VKKQLYKYVISKKIRLPVDALMAQIVLLIRLGNNIHKGKNDCLNIVTQLRCVVNMLTGGGQCIDYLTDMSNGQKNDLKLMGFLSRSHRSVKFLNNRRNNVITTLFQLVPYPSLVRR